ncbi:hypothetical protein T09_15357 [Trichinella sp. T9]|nr:hypothetical protein T09_15357 [Trichinella sp. T9]
MDFMGIIRSVTIRQEEILPDVLKKANRQIQRPFIAQLFCSFR